MVRIHQIDISTREVAVGNCQTTYVAEAHGVHTISWIGNLNAQVRKANVFPLADEGEAKEVVVGKGGFREVTICIQREIAHLDVMFGIAFPVNQALIGRVLKLSL